jgi:glucose/arabinose dehydrogenase
VKQKRLRHTTWRINRASRAGQHFGFPWYGSGKVRTAEYKADTPPSNAVFPQIELAPTRPTSA